MKTATFSMEQTSLNGKRAFEIIVNNSASNKNLNAECERLGLVLTVGIANRRSILVTSPAEMDTVRTPLLKFFKSTPVNGILEAL